MKRDISLWSFGGFVFSSLGGTVLHFLYDWTNEWVLVAPFSGVNESTWEHMKLLYFPMLVFAFIQRQFFEDTENFWCVKLCSFTAGLVLIPVLFYTMNGIIGKTSDWLNILIFFISAAAAFLLEYRLFKKNTLKCKKTSVALAVILFLGILFVLFTFFPPNISLFQDPLTGTYGKSR